MSGQPTHCQCLLFVSDEENHTAGQHASHAACKKCSCRGPFNISPVAKVLVLIPEAYTTQHPQLLEVFKRNDLQILSDKNVSSLFGADNVEIIEILLDDNPRATSLEVLNPSLNTRSRDVDLWTFPEFPVKWVYDNSVHGLRPAVDDANSEAFNRLLAHRAASRHRSIFKSKKNVLNIAARTGHEEFVRLLLDRGADVDGRDIFGDVSLHAASFFGRAEVAQLLVNRGAAVEAMEHCDFTPLHLAAWRGHGDIVHVLLDHGTRVDCKDRDDSTPLHYAASGDHPEVVRALIKRGSAVDAKDKGGCTPLFKTRGGDVAEILIQNGADPNAKSNDLRLPIFNAVEAGHGEVVDTLLKYGARVDPVTGNDESLLKRAVKGRNFPHYLVFKFLLESIYAHPNILIKTVFDEVLFGNYSVFHCFARISYNSYVRFLSILYHHAVKVAVLYDYSLDSFRTILYAHQVFPGGPNEFERVCELEVRCLKTRGPCNTDLSWLEILAKDESQVARLLKNDSVAGMVDSDELNQQFPNYSGILKCHLLKGKCRKLMIEEGMETFNFLSASFKELPFEIKENIFGYLSNRDILIFIGICERPDA